MELLVKEVRKFILAMNVKNNLFQWQYPNTLSLPSKEQSDEPQLRT